MRVKASGPREAKIAIVGEAPGEKEGRVGVPFVGPAGRVLDTALRQVGLTREDVYVTNVCDTRPPRNDFGAFYQDKARRCPTAELDAQIARLKEELKDANVVVVLGNEALHALTGKDGIVDRRGSVEWCEAIEKKCVYAIHPSVVLKDPKSAFYPLLVFDLTRAKREAQTPTVNRPPRIYDINPSVAEVRHHIERLKQAREPVSFDIETSYGGSEWHCIAFSDDPGWAMCVPTSPQWGVSPKYCEEVVPLVVELLEDPKVPMVAQNAQFDVLFLRAHYGIDTKPVVFDTMTGHHTVYPELPKSLAVLTSIYTDQPFYKDMGKHPPELWTYNAIDAAVTYECYLAIRQEMGELGLTAFYETYVMPLMWPLMDMQQQGVCVNVPERERVAKDLQNELDDLQVVLNHEVYGWGICQEQRKGTDGKKLASQHQVGLSAQSPKQMQEFLFKTLRLPKTYARGSGKVTVDDAALKRLRKKTSHPALDIVMEMRAKQKLLSTYVLAPLGDDERMRCAYIVGGTETGRLSSRGSIFGTGTNLQNVPKGVARRLLVPSEGLVFVESDLSQAEARVVAHLANDLRLIKAFDEGGDVHRENAGHLFHGGDASKVTPEERTIAKRLVHAANYGIGPRKFHEVLVAGGMKLTVAEAEKLLHLYHARFPKIGLWHSNVESQLRKTRMLTTPVGRKRQFFGRWGDELLREAYAYVPQSTVADILNAGLVRLSETITRADRRGRLVLTVHDSVVVECRESHVKRVGRHVRRTLESELEINGRRLVIPADLKWGKNWNDMVELDV